MKSNLCLFLLSQQATPTFAKLYARQAAKSDILDWVDPLIGSRNGGNVFAGATLPYGMAKGWGTSYHDRLQQLTTP
jgi:hypothetical protein